MAGRPLSRRTAVAGALAAPVALAACDIDPPRDAAAPTGPDGPPAADGTDDVDLLAEVVDGIESTMALAVAARARPADADLAARLTALHEAQVAVLGAAAPEDTDPGTDSDSPDASATPAPAPDDAGAAEGTRLVPAERALQRLLARSAATAQSGDLARVLASAAAAIAQELAVDDLARRRP